MSAFLEFYEGLPRQGPGDRVTLDRALADLNLPPDAAIADAGCGVGADIPGLLAHAPHGTVYAVDTHAPFIETLLATHKNDPRVTAEAADMATLTGPYDLIWCAGALYFLGLVPGLAAMRKALKPGGALVFSEPVLRTDSPSAAVSAFWEGEPPPHPRGDILNTVEASGFEVVTEFALPDSAWEAYYKPMMAHADTVEPAAGAEMAKVLADARSEAANWQAAKGETGYLSVTARLRDV
ncbi:MAG: class I SAM-dependent methyltransferase [Pseudomonadota bacterium]